MPQSAFPVRLTGFQLKLLASAAMLADHIAVQIKKITCGIILTGVSLHECDVIAIRHKADVLTVVFAGVDEALFLRNGSCLIFGQSTQREEGMRQLLLRKGIEYIALIFAFIGGLI